MESNEHDACEPRRTTLADGATGQRRHRTTLEHGG